MLSGILHGIICKTPAPACKVHFQLTHRTLSSYIQANSGSAANGSGQKSRGRGRGSGSAKRARGGTLTLQDLIDAGILFPGRNKISVHYKGTVYTASLGKDGMILYQGAACPFKRVRTSAGSARSRGLMCCDNEV